MRLGSQHVFIEFTMSFVSNGITKGCQRGYYVVLLPVGIRHFISLRLPSVKLGKVIPVSRVVRVCKCVSTLPTVPGTENVLNTCSYFFSYYNGGEIIEAWGEVTTKCELKQSIWNPFGNVWFHLYTIWFSCSLASMRETVHGLGVILMVGIFGEGQDWDG